MSALARRLGPVLGLLVLAATLVIGADLFGAREMVFGSATPAPRAPASSRADPFTSVAGSGAAAKTVLRSEPWWQQVGRFAGTQPKSVPSFRISADAIQWRVKWSCRQGRFVARTRGQAKPLIDAPCAGDQTTELTAKIGEGLQIGADGPWTARVEQQVDVPLIEPPLRAMSAPGTSKIASAAFYRIDQVGKGRLTFYRLANGREALRLDDFYVSPNVDLEIRLSPLRAPHSTRQYLSVPSKLVAPLPITTGSINFSVPAGVDPRRYRSVVIWCPLIHSAYAAATLGQHQ